MRIRAKTNADEVIGDIDRWLGDLADKVAPAVVNELADRAETVGVREVAREYGLTQRDFRKYLRRTRARAGDPEAEIRAIGPALPVGLFSPIPTAKGVSVRIKGKRILIPHAFIQKVKAGDKTYQGVFARGAYGGKGVLYLQGESFGRFVFGYSRRKNKKQRKGSGRSRYSINELYTFGPSDAWRNETVVTAMQDRVESEMGKVMQQQIRRFVR
jgi:hypothetical protein